MRVVDCRECRFYVEDVDPVEARELMAVHRRRTGHFKIETYTELTEL